MLPWKELHIQAKWGLQKYTDMEKLQTGGEDTGAELVPPALGDLPARAPALTTVLLKSPMVPAQVAPCAPVVPVSLRGLGVP